MSRPTPDRLRRLVNILETLDDPDDAARARSAFLASREIQALGTTWLELLGLKPEPVHPDRNPPQVQRDLTTCLDAVGIMNDWQRQFIAGLCKLNGQRFSERQALKLAETADQVRRQCVA